MNDSQYLDRQEADFEEFLKQADMCINDKEQEVERKKLHHLQTMKQLQIFYFIFGVQVTVYSSIVTFLSGIYTYKDFSWFSITILIFSLLSTVLNSVLSFSNVVTKISKHREAYNKFELISMSIQRFKLNQLSKREIISFIDLLDNTLGLVKEYEILTCCFTI